MAATISGLVPSSLALVGMKKPGLPPGPSPTPAAPATAPGTRPGEDVNAAVRETLNQPLKEFVAQDQPLEKVLTFFAEHVGVSVFVDWSPLEAASIPRSAPVSVALENVPARRVLGLILQSVSPNVDLQFLVADGTVVISTADALDSPTYQDLRVYDLGPMFADVEPDGDDARQIADSFLDTLKSVIAPDSWRDNGGTIGVARIRKGTLIVNQRVDRRQDIANLIDTYASAVRVTTRAYDVHDLLAGPAPATPPATGPAAAQPRRRPAPPRRPPRRDPVRLRPRHLARPRQQIQLRRLFR
jgi:hypothetical protein